MPTKLILDVDTGTDDAVAIMLAALHPALTLLGVTTVHGNVPLDLATDNTLRVLDHIGATVPVHEGQPGPLRVETFPNPAMQGIPDRSHGRQPEHVGHGELDLPAATSRVRDSSAVQFLVETYRSATQPVTLVATGPLTTIAAAFTTDPGLAACISEMIVMGGAGERRVGQPLAEFNMATDPEAARIVLAAGVRRLLLVPLDATLQAQVSLDDCAALEALGTPAGVATASFVRRRIGGGGANRRTSAPVHDALCVAALVDRSLITTRPGSVDVCTRGALRGTTLIDVAGRSGGAATAEIAVATDRRRFVKLLLRTFR